MTLKTESELAAFYSRELLPVLRPLEEKRKKMVSGFLTIGAIVLVALLLVLISGLREGRMWWILLLPGAAIIWLGIYLYGLNKEYTVEFKNSVIAGLVKFLDAGLQYDREGFVALTEYENSRIFIHGVDRYRGDDLVSGTLGKTAICFSEIHSEYKTETTDSKGRRQTQWHTIFRGLFFIGDFNKEFSGCTVVLPDTAEKLFGGFLGGMLQKMNMARGQLIRLEDPEFEKNFVVYGEDQVTARYVLSTGLMERMLAYKNEAKKNVYFSFVDSKVYVAISYNKNLFEPKIFGSILDFAAIREYYKDLELAAEIVEELNLNTRIWSKA